MTYAISASSSPCDEALRALAPSQIAFLKQLPKAELHAHLNGSIPLPVLQTLAREHAEAASVTNPTISAGLERLQSGVTLDAIGDFFGLFPAIYAITSTPSTLRRAARAVLAHFLDGDVPQAAYIELRTTPRKNEHMSRRAYLEAVLAEVDAYPASKAALIVSLDRRMDASTAREVLGLAVALKQEGRRVVGVDLCGDPLAGDMGGFVTYFRQARDAGLGVTLHIAETEQNPATDTMHLLACEPHRLGHATFLNAEAKEIFALRARCGAISHQSGFVCKTVKTLDAHHIRYYLQNNHPIAVCTDDILPFRNSLLGEYALLLAPKPLGLGLSEGEVATIARMGMECRFGDSKV
ncbi:Metallo-dependent hydrolase [Amylostereum chailletii]|nr:Metallo-dependent hydrolase [Amylostereum chailletii]